MITLEFKAYGKIAQFNAIDEAIRTVQFIRNKALKFWQDGLGKSLFDLNKYCTELAKEFSFANELNSQARQASSERAWSAISRFFDNCKNQVAGPKGFPQFQKDNRSVEYKTSGWKLADDRKSITFTDKKCIGKLKLKGTRDLNFYGKDQIKRVRIVKRADGYYVQFCVKHDRLEELMPSGRTIGLDVGLNYFYTDSNGQTVENPRFLRKSSDELRFTQRRLSRKIKGSNNRLKARQKLGQIHLKISRQRKDFAVKLAKCVITSNDVVVYEDLRVKNMSKNHCLAKSINDAAWFQFRLWLEYFGKVHGKITVAVPAYNTSQACSSCGSIVRKALSTRTHICSCGCVLDRDHNAALNILELGLRTVGHTGTFAFSAINASGELTSTLAGAILLEQVSS